MVTSKLKAILYFQIFDQYIQKAANLARKFPCKYNKSVEDGK